MPGEPESLALGLRDHNGATGLNRLWLRNGCEIPSRVITTGEKLMDILPPESGRSAQSPLSSLRGLEVLSAGLMARLPPLGIVSAPGARRLSSNLSRDLGNSPVRQLRSGSRGQPYSGPPAGPQRIRVRDGPLTNARYNVARRRRERAMHGVLSETAQSWFVAKAAVALTPIFILGTADVISWFLRRTVRRRIEVPRRCSIRMDGC